MGEAAARDDLVGGFTTIQGLFSSYSALLIGGDVDARDYLLPEGSEDDDHEVVSSSFKALNEIQSCFIILPCSKQIFKFVRDVVKNTSNPYFHIQEGLTLKVKTARDF